MKKKIIIIGANDFQNQLVVKAKDMGYETHVFAWRDGAVAEKNADYFYPISITDKEEILEEAIKINPDGIISIASDLAVATVNYIANRLNLTGNSDYSSIISTNKFEMRKKLTEKLLPCPKFILTDKSCDVYKTNMSLPLIIKPIDRSGSRGVRKITDYSQLDTAIKEALSVSFSDKVIIEEFLEGKEYSIEMISFNGQHEFLAITEKFTTGAPKFIETMHLQPARIDEEVKNKAITVIKKALDALEVKYGASHSEFKVDADGNIKIIEIGARMGGDCIGSDLVEISTGFDFKKAVIEVAAGKKPSPLSNLNNVGCGVVKFIFSDKDIEMLDRVKKHNPNNIWRISEIENPNTREITDSSTRFGYYIIKGSNVEECLNIVECEDI